VWREYGKGNVSSSNGDAMKERAIRRHHIARLKKKRQHYWLGGLTLRSLGIAANTPKPCSCYACGNPRRHFGRRTIQERRHSDGYFDNGEDF